MPVLTHPERLTWVHDRYDAIERLLKAGVWMQVTAGSLRGSFGGRAKGLARHMLRSGQVHILATDAHDDERRPPDLAQGAKAAAELVGDAEAMHLVLTRPKAVIENALPSEIPVPVPVASDQRGSAQRHGSRVDKTATGGLAQRFRRLFGQ